MFVSVALTEPIGLPCQTLFVSDGVSTVYRVGSGLGDSPHAGTATSGFLVPGTDTVYLSGVRLDSSDYTFDYNTGSIVFWRRPEKWVPVRVVYRCVRLPGMPREYRRHELPVSGDQLPVSESAAVRVAEIPTSAADTTGLDLSGSKTLGVSFGGRRSNQTR